MESSPTLKEIREALHTGQPQLVLDLILPLLEQDPNNVGFLRYKALALHEVGRLSEAGAIYRQIVDEVDLESRPLLWRQLGLIAQDQGGFEEAEEWFRHAMATDPQDPRAFIYLGAMLADRGRLSEAERYHREATACSEGPLEEAWLNLGFVLREQGRDTEALDCFEHALAIDPDYAEALEARELMNSGQDRPSEP